MTKNQVSHYQYPLFESTYLNIISAKTMNFVGGTRLKETHGNASGGFEEERFADAESIDGKKGLIT